MELIHIAGIRDFQLLEYIQKGQLRPYDRFGLKAMPPDYQVKKINLKNAIRSKENLEKEKQQRLSEWDWIKKDGKLEFKSPKPITGFKKYFVISKRTGKIKYRPTHPSGPGMVPMLRPTKLEPYEIENALKKKERDIKKLENEVNSDNPWSFYEIPKFDELAEKAMKEIMEHHYCDDEFVKLFPVLQIEDKPEISTKTKIKPRGDIESFISKLELRFESDDTILLRETGKKAKLVTCQSLGFRDNSTRQWQDFINILQKPPHTYCVGTSWDKNQRSKKYDAKQGNLREINKKLIIFLNGQLSLSIPKNYKLYKLCPAEKPGTYKFKFKIGFDYGYDKSYYDKHFTSLSKTELIDQICKLYEEYKESEDKEIMEKIKSATIIANTKHKMSESEIGELIKPDKEEHIYDPWENQEDRKPDY